MLRALNPNNAFHLYACGYFLAMTGEWQPGLEMVAKAMRLNPH